MFCRPHRDLREHGGVVHARGPNSTACHSRLLARWTSDSRSEVNFKAKQVTRVEASIGKTPRARKRGRAAQHPGNATVKLPNAAPCAILEICGPRKVQRCLGSPRSS